MAGMDERQVASREELERRVAERLDLDPATVRSRVVTAQPLSGGLTLGGEPDVRASGPGSPAPAPRRASAALTSRERRERALLAMCIAMPDEGKEYLDKLTAEHLSPLGARALAWLREHPEDPASNLPMDDTELAGLIAELVILANDDPASPEASNEPPSPEAMKLNFMLLEQRRLEAEISAAGRGRRPRAPRRPQHGARRPGRAHSPDRAGQLAGRFHDSFRGSSIGRARDC